MPYLFGLKKEDGKLATNRDVRTIIGGFHGYTEVSLDQAWAGSYKPDVDACIRLLKDIGNVDCTLHRWPLLCWRKNQSLIAQSRCYQENIKSLREIIDFPHVVDHYARAFNYPEKSNMVEFIKNEHDGMYGVMTEMKIGKYLKKYGTGLTGTEIGDMVAKWNAFFGVTEMQFTTTGDEVMEVYANGPGSCMSGPQSEELYPSGLRAYAGKDLCIAYIERKGKPTARSVCWKAKGIYLNYVYGDLSRFRSAATKAGIRSAGSSEFSGAKMSRQQDPRYTDPENFIVPYMDISCSLECFDDYVLIT